MKSLYSTLASLLLITFVSGSFEGGLPGNSPVSLECREDPSGLRASCRDVQVRHEKAR